jgi:hypothetical protein
MTRVHSQSLGRANDRTLTALSAAMAMVRLERIVSSVDKNRPTADGSEAQVLLRKQNCCQYSHANKYFSTRHLSVPIRASATHGGRQSMTPSFQCLRETSSSGPGPASSRLLLPPRRELIPHSTPSPTIDWPSARPTGLGCYRPSRCARRRPGLCDFARVTGNRRRAQFDRINVRVGAAREASMGLLILFSSLR